MASETLKNLPFLQMSSDMFGYIHLDGKLLPLNPAWEQILGFTCTELQARQWMELVHPDDQKSTSTEFTKLKTEDCNIISFENRFMCSDGDYKRLFWTLQLDTEQPRYCAIAKDITKQKRIEAKLRENEKRFKQLAQTHAQESDFLHTLMDNAPDHIYFKDIESKFIRINRSLANRFGLKNPANAVGKSDFDFFTREHAQEAYQDERTVIDTGKPIEGKREKETWPGGQDTWVSTTKVPIRDRSGRIKGTCGISRDITEYHRADRALRDSEAKWRSLVESAPDIIVTLDLDYQLQFINRVPTGVDLTIEDIVGESVFDFLTDEHHDGFRKACQQVIETGEVAGYEIQGRISQNWYASWIAPIKRDDKLVGFIMTSTNITDRKQAETELQESEQRFRRAVLNAPLPIMIHAENGEVILISRAWTELTGYTAEEMTTVSKWLEQANSEMSDEIQEYLVQVNQKKERSAPGQYEIMTKAGKKQIWEFSSSLLGVQPDGKRTIISMALNNTDRIKAQQAMQSAKETAEYASRAKSDFLANMSHELRTPLNAIIGFAEILRDELVGPVNDELKECVNDIRMSGQHLLEMINDILDLSKIEAGKMFLQLEEFAIVDAVEEVNAIIKALALKKNIELTLECQQNATIHADRVKVKQIFYNLLSNAVKFTPEGGKVTTQLEVTPTDLQVKVIDTGIGIAEEDRMKLFAPFTQIDTSKSRRYGGTGLGLALTQRLIELHGGQIQVTSEEGKGSTFSFNIPTDQPNASI
ncbi:MAG: PAS domain S-box protein [Candidatus Poribacteria bacterium]|nr:PAS domain S-box protein [Candidatus Poribacteria bacterium]